MTGKLFMKLHFPGLLVLATFVVLAAPGCGGDSGTEGGDTNTEEDAELDIIDSTEPVEDVVLEPDAEVPSETTYCGNPMLELPDDPAARGPWPVGSRTVEIDVLHTEVWYPAEPGSEVGQELYRYDLREYLPDPTGVEPTDDLMLACECYRELPIDAEHGPYPVIVFAHGMSGFKGQSLEFMTHWASRGFVVLSSDAPSIGLKTFLELFSGPFDLPALLEIWNLISSTPSADECDPRTLEGQPADLVAMLDALDPPSGDLAFLEGHVDLGRIGATGHSAGGMASYAMGGYPNLRVVIPMAAAGTCDGASLESTVVIGGMADSIVAFTRQQDGYDTSPVSKRLIGLTDAGHMAMTSFCPIGEGEGGILEAAKNAGVEFNPLFESFITPLASDGCGPDNLEPELGWEIINYASAAAFEEILMCIPERGEQLSGIADVYPEVGEYQEQL